MTPKTMRALEAKDFSIDALGLAERPVPKPRRGEILVRIKAASLNYRDLAILAQKYLPTLALPYVPASDACGEVVEVGEEVTRFKVGDRVTPIYTQGWHDGLPTLELRTKRTLGAPLSGVLQEYIAVGSRARFEAMNRAIAQHKLKPVVDSTFPLEKAADAFRHIEQGKRFGKIVVKI